MPSCSSFSCHAFEFRALWPGVEVAQAGMNCDWRWTVLGFLAPWFAEVSCASASLAIHSGLYIGAQMVTPCDHTDNML